MWNVEQWMTPNPEALEPQDSALDALDRMVEGEFRHMPVVNQKGVAIGIVSIGDLRAALPFDVAAEVRLPEMRRAVAGHYQIAELMTYLPFTTRCGTPLEDAVRQLMERRIGSLLVVDARGALAGIFTETDALRALLCFVAGGAAPAASPRDTRGADEQAGERGRLVSDLQSEQQRISAELIRCEQAERALAAAQHGEPMDEIDRRALTEAGALAGALAAFAGRRLLEIDCALGRHAQGTFGICSSCGRDIPLARLRALPSAQSCVRCARAGEARAAVP